MSTNDDNFSVGPLHPWFPSNGPEKLNKNYGNQQKHYQIRHRKLEIPESFLSSLAIKHGGIFEVRSSLSSPAAAISFQNSL